MRTKQTVMAVIGAVIIASAGVSVFTPSAAVEPRSADEGRYSMKEVDGSIIRLDTVTGTMSTCTRKNESWECEAIPDSQKSLRDELNRLRTQNAELKAEIKRMEDVFGLSGPSQDRQGEAPSEGGAGSGKPSMRLPNEEEVDRAIDYLESMIRKFRERFEDFGEKTEPRNRRRDKEKELDEPHQL